MRKHICIIFILVTILQGCANRQTAKAVVSPSESMFKRYEDDNCPVAIFDAVTKESNYTYSDKLGLVKGLEASVDATLSELDSLVSGQVEFDASRNTAIDQYLVQVGFSKGKVDQGIFEIQRAFVNGICVNIALLHDEILTQSQRDEAFRSLQKTLDRGFKMDSLLIVAKKKFPELNRK